MPKRFGTDGIRGVANADLSAELSLEVGRAVAAACRQGVFGGSVRLRPRVVVGRDTRPSGDLLEAALVAGLCSGGADALLAGVIPTPGVAFLTGHLDADAGIVLSASHNPPADNGIKVFGPGGWKLSEMVENALEALLGRPSELPTGADVGVFLDVPDAEDRYVDHLVSSVSVDLTGTTVVVDCGHGAAFRVAPRAFARLGARVVALHDAPDGMRINQGCGATNPEVVADAARREGAIGITHDGDADRMLAADEEGTIVDGDAVLALLASTLRARNLLSEDAVAVTVMANQALRAWCASESIRMVETAVGDRYVLEAMREQGLVLGGEQSGHIIRLDLSTTGDGVLSALCLLETLDGARLADAVPFRPYPQVLVNVQTPDRDRLHSCEPVLRAIRDAETQLGTRGRVLVRPSGTEPLVRVMVEAASEADARTVANQVAGVVEREMGATATAGG